MLVVRKMKEEKEWKRKEGKKGTKIKQSSLHCNISLSLCLFSCFGTIELSVNDVTVSQKSSNGEGKLKFFGQDYYLDGQKELSIGWPTLKNYQRFKILLKMSALFEMDRVCD